MKTVLASTIEKIENRRNFKLGCMEMIKMCGGNTGNICFSDAIAKQLDIKETIPAWELPQGNNFDSCFVLPASNWINEQGTVLKRLFLPLDKKNVKIACIGLGIQSSENIKTPRNLLDAVDRDTVRALKILSEHSTSIGIRGSFTAEVLDKLEIHNWRIIGCPSFYEPYRKWGMGGGMIRNKKIDYKKVVCNVTPMNYIGFSYEHKIMEMAIREKNTLIMQTMLEMPLIKYEGKDLEKRHIESRYPGLKIDKIAFKEYMQKYSEIFFTKDQWDKYLEDHEITFCYGSRMHGNLAAFTNGIPALWIMHDGRTKELIEALHLPFITYNQLLEFKSVRELTESCIYDIEFERHYDRMCQSYIRFLDENSVSHFLNQQ